MAKAIIKRGSYGEYVEPSRVSKFYEEDDTALTFIVSKTAHAYDRIIGRLFGDEDHVLGLLADILESTSFDEWSEQIRSSFIGRDFAIRSQKTIMFFVIEYDNETFSYKFRLKTVGSEEKRKWIVNNVVFIYDNGIFIPMA